MSARKFLVVDDDADDAELFAEAVGSVDPSVACMNASHGKEALDKLVRDENEKPDIIFLDINMPVMNGWQFLSKIKESPTLKAIPIIMYSTSSKATDISTAKSSGALCFFTKPTSFMILKKILRIVINFMEIGQLDKVCEEISKA